MTAYIYGLKCPLTDEIRYVGKSVNPKARLRAHIGAAGRGEYDHHTARWIRKLITSGNIPVLIILHVVAEGEVWQDEERRVIRVLTEAGVNLTNSTAGGEGLDYINEDEKAAYLANLSAVMKALWNTPERREEARQRSIDAWADPEVTERRIGSLRAFYDAPENRTRASAVATEINSRPSVRAKKSVASKLDWQGEAGERRRASLGSDDVRARMSEAARLRWADGDARAELMEVRGSPEVRAKISQRAKERATPEYRAMMAEKTRLSWEKRRLKKAAEQNNSQAA